MTNSVITVDLFLFAVTATLFTLYRKNGFLFVSSSSSNTCSSTTSSTATTSSNANNKEGSCSATVLKNSAFVFVKPHANTAATQKLVASKLMESGCTILSEYDINGTTIDQQKLIDQHYYSIASKATILPAKDIPVPKDKFLESFGESWENVLKENRAYNALDACTKFNCTPEQLNDAWGKANAIKFGGGFYCALVTVNEHTFYVFNAFFMTMRSKFVNPAVSIHCYEIEFDPQQLSWSTFRNNILGPTDPNTAPIGSIRRTVLDKYVELGLSAKPDKGDNGVHASASPFEGLAEKLNWAKKSIREDPFGQALLSAGLTIETIQAWSIDPQINLPNNEFGSIFDALEDLDVSDCLAKLITLNELNKKK